jgi:phenylacetate-CoA ligase
MSRSDDVYARLPLIGQHAAVTAFGASWAWARFGPGFRRQVAGFKARDRWDDETWAAYADRAATAYLTAAVERVPHYRQTYTAEQQRAARAGRLQELPILEKAPLRQDPEQFINPALRPRRPRVFLTSGSSGTPVATTWSVDELRASMALREVRSAGWAGVSFRQPRATFSGRMVEPDPDSTGPFYRFNAVERQVYLSPFHLRPDTAGAYAHALRRHNTRWATGYAGSFALLAKFILDAGIEPLSLEAVITTSEKLTDHMRANISAAFGCPVFEEYAAVENAFLASECREGSLHVSPDAGIIEILRPDGSATAPGEVGAVVATALLRKVQPLIRYRIGDLASWAPNHCACGRGMPVIDEVCGRIEDVVVGPDGRQLVRFHGVFVGLPHVVEAQVVQEAIDRLRILVVPDSGFDDEDEREMVRRMRQRLGDVHVRVVRVDQIPRTASGKLQAVVSELPSETT